MTHPEVIQRLFSLRQFGMKLGLEKMRELARRLGNPQQGLRFIHVAGTNGKGSTCAFLESLCRAAGLRTGLYTSPHLVRFGERIQVNRHILSEEETLSLAGEILPVAETFTGDDALTFFEIVTAMALVHFRRRQCDVVIWETGMGGRLDATNIVTPMASVITPIGMDHQQWLGDTLEKIAAEKAGIIKSGVPVITAPQVDSVMTVLDRHAAAMGSRLRVVGPDDLTVPALTGLELPLAGQHQRWNAATALVAAGMAEPPVVLSTDAARAALASTSWPGRLQRVRRGTQTLWLDGAHNTHGAEALRAAMSGLCPERKPALIVGMMRDKSCEEVLRILVPIGCRILLVGVDNERSASPEELRKIVADIDRVLPATVHDRLAEALKDTESEPVALITGSLYLMGEALEALGLEQPAGADGRRLSERLSSPGAGRAGGFPVKT